MSGSEKSTVIDNILFEGDTRIRVGSRSWYEWLASARRFSFKGAGGNFVAQCEKRRNKVYWYAYRRAGKLFKFYLGKAEELTPNRLEQASLSLLGQTLQKNSGDPTGGGGNSSVESRIDSSILPLTKVNAPALPRQLLPRPRLTRQINTPLTVIHAPRGFGKTTLSNDWKRNCGHPVAWLSLEVSDNDIVRFWYSVITALRTIEPALGGEALAHLGTASPAQLQELISHLTNEIVNFPASPIGLLLDDFHRIHQTEIYDSLQSWLEYLPPNIRIVLLGHTRPPLSFGHLRSRGLLTELDANDLRFTLEEGIEYLRQYQQSASLAYDDLAKLVRHTEGWAAGLTLAALALGKQEDHRQFVDTFSGAHIYMREYFMETVLQRSSPDVQTFLLKTSILKQLTGSLCDEVTGLSGGAEMLMHLWQENLFIVRLDEQGWYRYHDLFSEMLSSQLQSRFPDDVSELHRRAANWYRAQQATADAIYHFLMIEAWEEAALLMEEMALRELEQYGEDSRLLRWLQELPASVVQRHKMLLYVYLRLAHVALPQQAVERFINQIENQLSNKPDTHLTQDEREVSIEIRQLRRAWEQGEPFNPPQEGSANDSRWELLNGLHLLKQPFGIVADWLEQQISELLRKAQLQKNLFLILMAGGVLARLALNNGQLRRSAKIARQVLEQALVQRGKLPEPASIALATLSQVHLERNELVLAQQYLAQALEVDPNPTSTNMLVQIGVQRAEIKIALGNFSEALAILQSVRDLHLRRPSGTWTDRDLRAYEAFVLVRQGDVVSAERIMNELIEMGENGLSQLVRAEISLAKKQSDVAERQLVSILSEHPGGIPSVPVLRVRVLLARALFEQNKIHQALQVIKEVIRVAAPEHFIRPLLEAGAACLPVFDLALQTGGLNSDAQAFIREVLRASNYRGSDSEISSTEIESLSVSASISPREKDVLRLLSAGDSNRAIAEKLTISESTVKTHVANLYAKLNVSSRVQAITRAKELKLV